MANFKNVIKIGGGLVTAIVGGIVALKGAKASKECDYDATLEDINEAEAPATETAEPEEIEPEEVEPEAEEDD